MFPFGFGLSYTTFEIRNVRVERQENGLGVYADITNTGHMAGREVLQLYLSADGTKSERPARELKGFDKTGLLEPGESEQLRIFLPWSELAVYEEEKAVYAIEEGTYRIRIGNSSRDTREIAKICVEEAIITQDCQNRLGLQACNRDRLEFLSQRKNGIGSENKSGSEGQEETMTFTLRQEEAVEGMGKNGRECTAQDYIMEENIVGNRDVKEAKANRVIAEQNLQDFSIEELAALCVGYGPGTPFAAFGDGSDPETIFDKEGRPLTTNSHPAGFNGYVSPAIERRGIQSVFYKDGPAGVGETAWPSEMLVACAFDRKLWREFGDAVGYECEKQQVDVWLAPAVNLHRNPLCGRNFEYLSEDPYLTGVCACEITHGVQDNHSVLVCSKHFAVNEQETYRRGSSKKNYDATDSILTERAARELYLKPFEMLVKENNVLCIMSSFNKINGRFAGGSFDLCSGILREEWGYQGVVVTDWGDMDIVVDGADAVAAGNDIVMPGGPPVIAQILDGYREGRVTRSQLEAAVGHLLYMIGH